MNRNFNTKEELLTYAKALENNSVEEALKQYDNYKIEVSEDVEYRGKGGFGNFIEKVYFDKENDNISKPDFDNIGVELKVSPLKYLETSKIYKVKERLVLGIINYNNIIKEDFDTSHFLDKNQFLLLIFYFHVTHKNFLKYKIDLVELFNILENDLNQIREDWLLIKQKVLDGKAHELSEGDTNFLGACTKGATTLKSMTKQPNSNILARTRALCFKQSYINQIYKNLKDKRISRRIVQKDANFNQTILNLFTPYLGKSQYELKRELNIISNAKHINAMIARKIMGFRSKNETYYEMEAANIQIKTIRVEENLKIKESMSFKNINYLDIVDEEWEDSEFYQELISKFIFVIFKNKMGKYYLDRIKFWNMKEKDIDALKLVWQETKDKIKRGEFNNFIRIKDNKIAHVRPKGKNSQTMMKTKNYGEQKSK